MSSNHGKLPIPLPTIIDDARWVGRFSREVRKAIAALRDREIITSQQPRGKSEKAPEGAFLGLYRQDGAIYLQGGSVSGGNGGSATIDDRVVIAADAEFPLLDSGDVLYLKADCTATVTDGLMLPGCELTAASLVKGISVPPNDTFSVTSHTGSIYIEVGRWNNFKFLPSGPAGNFLASGCIGNFSLSKI